MVHIYRVILLSHKDKWNNSIFRTMDVPRDCSTEWSKSEREKQICVISIIHEIYKNGADELLSKAEILSQT